MGCFGNCTFDSRDCDSLRRYRHAVAIATEIADPPISVTLLDTPLVVFRSNRQLAGMRYLPITIKTLATPSVAVMPEGERALQIEIATDTATNRGLHQGKRLARRMRGLRGRRGCESRYHTHDPPVHWTRFSRPYSLRARQEHVRSHPLLRNIKRLARCTTTSSPNRARATPR